jgi:hypothetical protein
MGLDSAHVRQGGAGSLESHGSGRGAALSGATPLMTSLEPARRNEAGSADHLDTGFARLNAELIDALRIPVTLIAT